MRISEIDLRMRNDDELAQKTLSPEGCREKWGGDFVVRQLQIQEGYAPSSRLFGAPFWRQQQWPEFFNRLLQRGGMGEVFLARDTRLDRKVTIKVLPAEFASDRQRLSRFELEAKTLASLDHPNILSISGPGVVVRRLHVWPELELC